MRLTEVAAAANKLRDVILSTHEMNPAAHVAYPLWEKLYRAFCAEAAEGREGVWQGPPDPRDLEQPLDPGAPPMHPEWF